MSPRSAAVRFTTLLALLLAAAFEGGWKWDHFPH
jgi:hypothetical protein